MDAFSDQWEEWEDGRAEWSKATFGEIEQRGPIGPLKHLLKELEELEKAEPGSDEQYEEWADCQFLLSDCIMRAGVDPLQAALATDSKSIIQAARMLASSALIAFETAKDNVYPAEMRYEFTKLGRGLLVCAQLLWRLGSAEFGGQWALQEAMQLKLQKNKNRQWPKPTGDNPVEHLKGGEDGRNG